MVLGTGRRAHLLDRLLEPPDQLLRQCDLDRFPRPHARAEGQDHLRLPGDVTVLPRLIVAFSASEVMEMSNPAPSLMAPEQGEYAAIQGLVVIFSTYRRCRKRSL